MSDKIPVLNEGYVQLIEAWGSDERIIESARMSTDKGFLGWGQACVTCKGSKIYREPDIGLGYIDIDCPTCKGTGGPEGDEKLLRYLYRNKHMSPFEMAGAIFEVQAPIFVFREWHR